MIILTRRTKSLVKLEFSEALKLASDNRIDFDIVAEIPIIFQNCYQSEEVKSKYYIKFRHIPSSKIYVLNFELFKTKKYGKTINEKIDLFNYYEIEYNLPEEFSKVISLFSELKEFIINLKNFFPEISFVYLNKLFDKNDNIIKAGVGFEIKCYDDVEKIKEFVKNFINLTNEEIHIKIDENKYSILMRGDLNNTLDFDKFNKIFEIVKIQNGLREINIHNLKTLKLELSNFMSIETDLNEFLQDFDGYVNSVKFFNSNLVNLILNYVNNNNCADADSLQKQEIFKLIAKIVKRFKNEFAQIENFINLIKL